MAKEIKFKFESDLPHQKEAVESVVNIFKGFSQDITDIQFGGDVVSNIPEFYDFEEEWLFSNYQSVVAANNESKKDDGLSSSLPLNAVLAFEEGFMLSGVADRSVRFPVFTIEMETGTGKTYAYLRTILELKKQYGFRKYVVVVPSIAIYEGTIKAFKQTKEHFKTLYGNENIHLTEYDGQQISRVRSFATSSFIEILVMTIDSFNKSSNIIFKPTEKLQGEWLPIQYIQATRPILILDESQNYRSDLSREALRTLNPLFAINYSATPVVRYNLLYRLSPVDAFRHNLVKKIKVLGVTEQDNANLRNTALSIESINNEKGLPTATIKAYCIDGGVKTLKSIKIKKDEDLKVKTKNPALNGFVVEEIHAGNKSVTFTNQVVLRMDDTDMTTLSKKEIFRVQIEESIKYHFDRQKALLDKGIKVLSLFFIDRVANYKGDEPFIKTIFEAAFDKLKKNDEYFKKFDASDVHKGYFAQKKGETSFIDEFDIKGTPAEKKKIQEAEKEAYHLIMRDKEKLLDFSETTAFIFAHSALREGWDNPNVFVICTLNTTKSENRKRQEIGRGLRLARNSEGNQVKEEGVNILTVVANESYESYVNSLQTEYTETGDIAPPAPTKATRAKTKRNDKIYKSRDFKDFWERLSKQTDYQINIDTGSLIEECSIILNSEYTIFPDPQIVISRGEFVITTYTFSFVEAKLGNAKINLKITDTNGRKDVYENQWYHKGYDFWRKSKDINLKGFKIVDIDMGKPTVTFGNGKILDLKIPYSYTGDPGLVQNERTVQEAKTTYPVFNIIERASQATGLTRTTIISIFKKIDNEKKSKIFNNPEGFSGVFIKVIKETLADHIAKKIEYRLMYKIKKASEPGYIEEGKYFYNIKTPENKMAADEIAVYNSSDQIFPAEKEYPQRELISGSEHSLYDQIQIDSDVEKRFVENRLQPDDEKGNVVCYFKFPGDFKIKIPKIIGNYNPDWGIVRILEDGTTKIQIVRETKGNLNPKLLQHPNEARKIACAKKHFKEIGIKYKQIDDTVQRYWED